MSVAPGRRATPLAPLGLPLVAALLVAPIVLPETGRAERRFAAAQPADGDVRRAPGDLRPVDETTKGQALTTLAAPGPDGPFELRSTAVDLLLDAFGSFGSASSGGPAEYRLGWRSASTVFEWMAHVGGAGFLDGGSLLMPQSAASARRDGSAVVASYVVSDWAVDVRSELLDCEEDDCAVLRQEWKVTNAAPVERDLLMSFYLDGDLYFDGAWSNDHGALADDTYQFDHGSDPTAPSTFLGLSAESSDSLSRSREVAEFPEQRRRIAAGGLLADGVLRRSNGTSADRDGDGVTDLGYDVSIAEQHDFGTLASGQSVTIVSRVRWGLGSIAELDPLVADAGPDRLVECEGADGTVVTLDGAGSTPDGGVASWTWRVDGRVVADTMVADVVLPRGDHVVSLEVRDAAGRRDLDVALLSIVDTTPPDVAVLDDIVLWPPDHSLVRVDLPIAVFDACDDDVRVAVLGVSSDEPLDVRRGGDGHTADADVVIDDSGALWLRRERQGGGDGREYRIDVAATDASGQVTVASVLATVPHDRGSRLRAAR